jgi:hypothetical protein
LARCSGPVIPAPGSLRKKAFKFKAHLSYTVRTCLKNQTKPTTKKNEIGYLSYAIHKNAKNGLNYLSIRREMIRLQEENIGETYLIFTLCFYLIGFGNDFLDF